MPTPSPKLIYGLIILYLVLFLMSFFNMAMTEPKAFKSDGSGMGIWTGCLLVFIVTSFVTDQKHKRILSIISIIFMLLIFIGYVLFRWIL